MTVVQDATALVSAVAGEGPIGAGFFVDAEFLLTARHVVGDADEVDVQPFGATPRRGQVLPAPNGCDDLDVALVRVELAADELPPPAVLIRESIESGPHRAVGFPSEDLYTDEDPGLEPRAFTGDPVLDPSTKRVKRLRLTGGQLKQGFSGGAVLSESSGAIVGIVDYSENPTSDVGGAAIPIGVAVEHFEELRELVARPPFETTKRWRDILGRERWERLDLVWDPQRQLDIYLSGDRSTWQIGLLPDTAGRRPRTVRDLGDEMSEVLVRWARSSGRRDKSEVQLLGRLLTAAVLPDEVGRHLPTAAASGCEPVLVRLHVDADSTLAELPWEFATVPHKDDEFLAAQDGYMLSRVDSGDVTPTYEPSTTSSVLAVVVQPPAVQTGLPAVVVNTKLQAWPTIDEVCADLREAVTTGDKLTIEPLLNPEKDALDSATAETAQHLIVHYIGFGFSDKNGPFIYLADGDGDMKPFPATEILESIAQCRPKLVVLEFGLPPLYNRDDPIGPEVVTAARDLGMPAMVTSRPVHPSQYKRFNQALYGQLRNGATIERSDAAGSSGAAEEQTGRLRRVRLVHADD